ncbi:MAG: carbamoyltransferase HypF [Bacteroidetes bacterium]|nr:carbamoyltransferase HypF [Bacteroidota bacterium]
MIQRSKIIVRGAVQGVGFRPFVYRLAHEMKLNGFVKNSSIGAEIEVEGEVDLLRAFLLRLEKEKPAISFISGLEFSLLAPNGYSKFQIVESEELNEKTAFILPDISVCDECVKELFDSANRRYLYPFINCTNCGPRYSIIDALPYDRKNTSMKNFEMCPECREEFINPLDRRFHAQPIACEKCGPSLRLMDNNGNKLSSGNDALAESIIIINDGKILALKGLGGYQLIIDAFNEDSILELRKRKNREEKPFALMAPNLEYIKKFCEVNQFEERLLRSQETPIVFLKKKRSGKKFNLIAPRNPYLGVMLPYTPLHHLLMKKLNRFVIATSGNISEEPMCFEDNEALERLGKICDYFLGNNRPILNPVDDSIARIVNGRELILRRARGYAPFPMILNQSNNSESTVLAVGGHLKNTVALKVGDNVFLSPHIGDLSNLSSYKVFENTIRRLQQFYSVEPNSIVHDIHPEYISTKYAKKQNVSTFGIQHHLAHVISCKVENNIECEVLGISWDGTGLGLDNTIWGGEFFILDDEHFSHAAQFEKFHLPGSELAVKEPRRSAAGILYHLYGERAFSDNILSTNFSANEIKILKQQLSKNINSPLTSSVGRLFDAAASILGICQNNSYEGQAGMMMEFNCDDLETSSYDFQLDTSIYPIIIVWREIIEGMLEDISNDISIAIIAKKFHNSLSVIILKVAREIGIQKIVLSGGCFQNMILTESTIKLLEQNNFSVYTHQRIPPNDGGISLGQAAGYFYKQAPREHFKKLIEDI